MRDDMHFLPDSAPLPDSAAEGAVVVRLAAQVVAMLASRGDGDAHALREDMVDLLEAASFSAEASAMDGALSQFRRFRISRGAIADHYVPEVARRLGQGWVDDRLTFFEVSQGSSRLQSLLRDIGRNWGADAADVPAQPEGPNQGAILLVVPKGEQHTLGAILITGQLRRKGISVCLRFAPSTDELIALVRYRRFNGVFLSMSPSCSLKDATKLIARIKAIAGADLAVVVGGSILSCVVPDLGTLGADAITNDLDLALQAAGLVPRIEIPRRSA
jgi:methylmalonyl-CoA mutase cobalamin-binding subunit